MSLVELIIAMVVISIAITGLLMVFNHSVRGSADPMLRKQAVAIAESMLNEVLAQPFSYCDPQDPLNDTDPPPASTAACTGGAAGSQDNGGGTLGPKPASESRFNAADPFDNVADYNGYTMANNIYSLDNGGAPIAALAGFSATVTVTRDNPGSNYFGLPSGAVLRISVRVTNSRNIDITLTGYRVRYAPNLTG